MAAISTLTYTNKIDQVRVKHNGALYTILVARTQLFGVKSPSEKSRRQTREHWMSIVIKTAEEIEKCAQQAS